jgi:hypothetical protein
MTTGHENFIYTQAWTCPEVEELRLGCETNSSFLAEF